MDSRGRAGFRRFSSLYNLRLMPPSEPRYLGSIQATGLKASREEGLIWPIETDELSG